MPVILINMSSRSYQNVIGTRALERLRCLGDIRLALDPYDLGEDECARLWNSCDFALTGWGVRPPRMEWLQPPMRLRAICHAAGSVRMFPRELIERGVVITSARAAIARTVAEFCLAGALAMLRNLAAYDTRTQECYLRSGGAERPGTYTLFERTVVLIGMGHVGRHFRDLLRPFGARVIAVDPALTGSDARVLGVDLMPLHEALPLGDIVSLHAPGIPETRGLIGARELSLLRDGALFINTARGTLVDTEALTAMLEDGRFSAVLDVTDPEPLPEDHRLRFLPNVLLTPHVAGPTTDELPRLGDMALNDLEALVHGKTPAWAIGLEAYDRMSF